VPAAEEIGSPDVILFDGGDDPARVAGTILTWTEERPVHRLRRRVRQDYAWDAIFQRQIRPLLHGGGTA
jgi:hypothetical protein